VEAEPALVITCGVPLLCYLAQTGEPLAGLLRPGNAGSSAAADHFEVLQVALEQLPAADLGGEILVRTDIGGQTKTLPPIAAMPASASSIGYEMKSRIREAIVALPETGWHQAVDAEGHRARREPRSQSSPRRSTSPSGPRAGG
jgi:hypothetical protein